jgi:tripartite-type tricarboxylate transporter receptor subunit TctC
MRALVAKLALLAVSAALGSLPAAAADPVSFKDKTITMIIPTTAGAGTDISARLLLKFFGKYLPGSPSTVASNLPAGHGTPAMNYLVQQAKPDGLTIAMGSTSQAEPVNYRAPQSKYDPTELTIVGALGLGDNAMMIRREAEPRLLDKSKPPVTIGSVGGVPRAGMNMAVWGIEYLGWNARWVVGYPGSSDLLLALERGEIDMTAFPMTYLTDKLTDQAKFKALYREGLTANEHASPRDDLNKAPSFVAAMQGRIKDPHIEKAYDYWRAGIFFKWLSMPPKVPAAIRDTYRAAFAKIVVDPEFVALAEPSLPGFSVISAQETEAIIRELARTYEESNVIDDLMRKQGLNVPVGAAHE